MFWGNLKFWNERLSSYERQKGKALNLFIESNPHQKYFQAIYRRQT